MSASSNHDCEKRQRAVTHTHTRASHPQLTYRRRRLRSRERERERERRPRPPRRPPRAGERDRERFFFSADLRSRDRLRERRPARDVVATSDLAASFTRESAREPDPGDSFRSCKARVSRAARPSHHVALCATTAPLPLTEDGAGAALASADFPSKRASKSCDTAAMSLIARSLTLRRAQTLFRNAKPTLLCASERRENMISFGPLTVG